MIVLTFTSEVCIADAFTPGVKRLGFGADHSPLSGAGVNASSYTSTPACLHGVVLS
jgi:hypothetical protein